jgi:AcrR family transcriptional regulator
MTDTTATGARGTRRARLRQELIADIKRSACRHLAEGGPAAVTLRGIARELGVSPATIYGYFDSLDALFTALITDGYDDLADAVAAGVDADPSAPPDVRMLGGLRAFRDWARANPAWFRLLYFSPVPGYEAPAEGPTLTASLRVFVPLLQLLVDGWRTGVLPPPEPGLPLDVTKFRDSFGLEITSDQLRVATEFWAEFHGLVALEINGHIHDSWVDPGALFDANVRSMAGRMGFQPA